MSIPEPFTDLFERMQQRYVGDESTSSPRQTVEKVVTELPEDEVQRIVTEFCELGVTFWAHWSTTEPLVGLSPRILALPPGEYWSAMVPLNSDMSMAYLRQRVVDFFGHFLDLDDEVAYIYKLRIPEYLKLSTNLRYPFGTPELPFGLPGYNC